MVQKPIELTTILENLSPVFWKKGRLLTFKHWPFQSPGHQCNPESMASAGFFAIGGKDEPDLAECFMCSKQLDGWEPEDDPWQEHKKHQPNCLFVSLNKSDEESLTIKELFNLIKSYYSSKAITENEKCIEDVKLDWKETAKNIPEIYEAKKKNQMDID